MSDHLDRDDLEAEAERLRALAIWLTRLDQPDGIEERRTVTLTKIIDRARQALEGPTLHRLEDVAEEFGVDLTEGETMTRPRITCLTCGRALTPGGPVCCPKPIEGDRDE